MIREHAKEIASRIAELWPTITDEQLRLAVDGLASQAFEFNASKRAVEEMYLGGECLFFAWAELKKRVAPANKVDPLTQPNSAESQARRRADEREKLHRLREYEQQVLEYVQALPTDELRRQRADFFAAYTGPDFTRTTIERMLNDGKWPASFVDWVYERRQVMANA